MKLPYLANKDAITLLSRIPNELASLVYIDPGWYDEYEHNDNTNNQKNYDEHILHTIYHSKETLNSNGVIVFHVPSNWIAKAHNLLSTVFTPERFVLDIILKFRRPRDTQSLIPNHSHLIIYSKTEDFYYSPPQTVVRNDDKKRFNKVNDSGKRYRLITLTSPYSRPNYIFQWQDYTPLNGHSWRFNKDKLDILLSDGYIELQKGQRPRLRQYIDEIPLPEIGSVWDDISFSLDELQEYSTQQPLLIPSRVLSAFTQENDVIVDPFCGAGTTLVAAQKIGRQWIGGDHSAEAIEISHNRLKKLDGDILSQINSEELFNQRQLADITSYIQSHKITLHTEGKTDQMHIQSALKYLNDQNRYKDLNIEFHLETNIKGDSDLYQSCRHLADVKQQNIHIFLFDRDNETVMKKVVNDDTNYKSWGNNVYSLVLPLPQNREDPICIEHYYPDDVLKRKNLENRRLYLKDEFNSRTSIHKNGEVVVKILKSTLIIDSDVYDIKTERSMALSKNDFAQLIQNKEPPFDNIDFSSFELLFKELEKIIGLNT